MRHAARYNTTILELLASADQLQVRRMDAHWHKIFEITLF